MQPSNDPSTTPTPTPVETPQPTTVPQPTQSTEVMNGMTPPTKENLKFKKKLGYILSIASIVIFFIAFYYGYVFGAVALLAAFGLLHGIKTKTTPVIVIASIGLLLNLGFYIISVFSNL